MFKNTSGWLLLSTKGAINCLCHRGSSRYGSIVKKRSFLTKFSTMIVKIFAFSVSIIFLQSALRSINFTSFIHRSTVTVVTWKYFLSFFSAFWLNLRLWNWKSVHVACSWFFNYCTKEFMNRFFRRVTGR